MIIPVFPYKTKAVNEEGDTTHEHTNYHNQVSQQLRYWFGGDNKYPPVLWDEENKKLVVNVNGTFTVVTPT